MQEHVQFLTDQFYGLKNACREGRAAQLAEGSNLSNVDKLRQVCDELDNALPFVTGTGPDALYKSSQTEEFRRRMQDLPWTQFYCQVAAVMAQRVRDAVENIPTAGFKATAFERLHDYARDHLIFNWSTFGVSPQERRVWERLVVTDLAPGDKGGWTRRLAQLRILTADL